MKIICVTYGFCVVVFISHFFEQYFLSFSHFTEGKPRIMQVTKQMREYFLKTP